MFIFLLSNVPVELLHLQNSEEDISIIIGENGSGKSTLLNEVAVHHFRNKTNVIAVANTIYDKFTTRVPFNSLRSTVGKSLANRTVINALKNIASNNQERMRNIANMLSYIGFDPIISFKLKGIKRDFRDKVIESTLSGPEKEDLLYFLNRYVDRQVYDEGAINLNFEKESFSDIKDSYLITIFLYEKQLLKLKLISGINIFLRKEGKYIPLLKASSGELTLVTTLIYITSVINENSVILVDEPENSLHPKWQTEYVKRLSELFYLYQPKVIISTHSPLILNGAEINVKNVKIFKGKNGMFQRHSNSSTNVEEIYEDLFDLTTPENRFISEQVVEQMNRLSNKEIKQPEFNAFIEELMSNSYDEKQKEALNTVLDLSKQVVQEIK